MKKKMLNTEFTSRYRGKIAQLNHAYAAGDAAAFEVALDAMYEGRPSVMAEVVKLSDDLQQALARFRDDSRMAALAHKEIPDARLRLDHVLSMTEQAANKTLDLIELSVPLANATVRSTTELMASLDDRSHNEIRRFLDETRGNFEAVRTNLSEVMLTQSFQDLTGQILRGVQRLIGEVEKTLGELTRITGVTFDQAQASPTALEGPAVPGVTQNAINGQADVDDLIAGLGI
ncbi:MAG: protein phosphatase CheZ [Pseudomonadota bacterium]